MHEVPENDKARLLAEGFVESPYTKILFNYKELLPNGLVFRAYAQWMGDGVGWRAGTNAQKRKPFFWAKYHKMPDGQHPVQARSPYADGTDVRIEHVLAYIDAQKEMMPYLYEEAIKNRWRGA